MPVGTSGKGLLLISGGIDSPVAGHMIAKRGMVVDCIHFHSYPYTNAQARDKVVELSKGRNINRRKSVTIYSPLHFLWISS